MIPVADDDIQLIGNHAEVFVLEGFVLLINVPDFQPLENHFEQSEVFNRPSEVSILCILILR